MKQSTRELELARAAAAIAPTLVPGNDGDHSDAPLRALASPALGPHEAHALLGAVLERRGGSATLALAARLAIDRVRRPLWLPALISGLVERPRAELWVSLALAADAGVAGAARALARSGSEAAARFLAGCIDGRARLLGVATACAGRVDGGARSVIDAIDRGQGRLFTAAEREALEDLERGLVSLAAQVLRT
ncbi:MAG TPA: hypothetical protein VL463_36590 [Kofleriaceae bacterium]|nr:hypothetical protein [Kofleriaceae bacterium]